MLWFFIAVASQGANAVVQILDKFLLTKKFPRPAVLTFWTAMTSALGVVFALVDFNFFPGWRLLVLTLLSGAAFTVALQFFYMAFKEGEASHISPFVGGLVPVATFGLSWFLLSERLAINQQIAVALLVVGSLIMSFEKSRRHNGWHIGFLWGALAAIFFALSSVLVKIVFLEETFSTGFVWARVGGVLAALPFLLSPAVRAELFIGKKEQKTDLKNGLGLLFLNKGLAALAFVGLNFAISLASATLVNALAGVQFALLFILIFFLSKTHSKFFREQFTTAEIISQSAGLIFIGTGLAMIV